MANTNYFVLNSLDSFRTQQRGVCIWSDHEKLFHLASNHKTRLPVDDKAAAYSAWQNSQVLVADQFNQLGFLSNDRKQLFYALNWDHKLRFEQENLLSESDRALLETHATAGPVLVTKEIPEGDTATDISLSPVIAPDGSTFVDLHLGGDGRVALIYSDGNTQHGLRLLHLSKRWQMHIDWTDVGEQTFKPKRCWVDGFNRIWVASDNLLVVFEGEPLPQNYYTQVNRFEPVFINPTPLRKVWQMNLPGGRELMALCLNATQAHLLLLMTDKSTQEIFSLSTDYQLKQMPLLRRLPKLPLVTDIGSPAEDHLFLHMNPTADEAPHGDFSSIFLDVDSVTVEKRSYPIHSLQSVRFVRGAGDGVRYLSSLGPKTILPLPQARYVSDGDAVLNKLLDTGNPDTWWDRIYLDATIPVGCELSISVNAFDDVAKDLDDWQKQPLPMKLNIASELPFYKSQFDHTQAHQGVYEILLQRETGAVRDIRGRYLKIKIHFAGDGRHTPAIEAMRVVYPRLSWQENYLPALFHQFDDVNPEVEGLDANGADFRERLLSLCDGIFSPIETRIAHAESWLLPQAAPKNHLSKLAAMLGEELISGWPEMRQRIWLACLSELQKWKGTYGGLCLALEIATDGAVSKGQIVPVENYLMRRTLATILGISMDDAEHPLTLGTRQSGNSIVGESLILSDDTSRDFIALLAPELGSIQDQAAATDFIDGYSNRISIVVHRDARPYLKGVQQLVQDFVPASLVCHVLETDNPFVLGLSPLLAIDTYLEAAVAARQVVLDDTYLGREGIMRNQATFSPIDLIISRGA